ncbi:MAG: 3-deoxy-manno-octulosonate cytidylyltransferase [Bacteroidetes bacterium 4572_112]|nr:MAG: 3-deoxy-manno-octulosonate cytidylyltransferase [Bacteroidetes bacterium 4572_112]
MSIIAIIPSRYDSSRFPGKPLADIDGISMIQRVYEQAQKVQALDKVVVATDDDRIFEHCKAFGANVMMTSVGHTNGTERITEVIKKEKHGFDFVLNIQGDEPFVHPEQIENLCNLISSGDFDIATLAKEITDEHELESANTVKVVMSNNNKALYFSRYSLPFDRNEVSPIRYKHIGMYAFKTKVLLELESLNPSALEQSESLEQLRWLENDYIIGVVKTIYDSFGIDTPEDIINALNKIKSI